ncbi:MAG: hypothetical protein ABSH25_17090 [Syntrophorhabdales bacterium]
MKELYPPKVRKAVDALLTKPGVCSPALRASVEAYAAGLWAGVRQKQELPANLIDYVTKVALYAYKTTDEDVTRLKDAGYSEDVVFEITLCASIGAGLARMEKGLTLLKREAPCASDNS